LEIPPDHKQSITKTLINARSARSTRALNPAAEEEVVFDVGDPVEDAGVED
jgi:hypothetical protein